MVYRQFGNTATTTFRPKYLEREEKLYGKYGKDGPYRVEFSVSGPLHINPSAATKGAVNEALARTTARARTGVQQDTPVDTGLLRSRWYGKRVTWDEYRLSNDIYYAPPVEARRQMLEQNLPKIGRILTEELDRAVPRHLG